MVKKFITREKLIEFVSASVILSFLHWLVVSVILKVLPSTFSEFFFSFQYIMFIGFMTLIFFILQFAINRSFKIKETSLVRGIKYFIGFSLSVMIILGEPFSLTFILITILKVFITVNILERF